jgi:hypothetical protein
MESARASTPQGHTSKEEWRSSAKVFYGPEEVVLGARAAEQARSCRPARRAGRALQRRPALLVRALVHARTQAQHTLSREAAGDVGDVVQIEIAPSVVSVTYLSADLRANARKLELSARARARCRLRVGEPNGGRRRRKDTGERERNSQQWRARLRDRAPASGLGVHITHNTVTVSQSSSVDCVRDDFHQIRPYRTLDCTSKYK